MLAFVDTETTGTDPDRHEIWEIGIILRADPLKKETDTENVLHISPDLSLADPNALRVNSFYDRTWEPGDDFWVSPELAAKEVAYWLTGVHLVGASVSFDAAFLTRFLRRYGQQPSWHYHLVDVEALAAGFLAAQARYAPTKFLDGGITGPPCDPAPPWQSRDLSRAVGVEPDDFDRHTAMGDARWARAIYDAVLDADSVPMPVKVNAPAA